MAAVKSRAGGGSALRRRAAPSTASALPIAPRSGHTIKYYRAAAIRGPWTSWARAAAPCATRHQRRLDGH